jgi:hypothetical protein
MVHSPVARGDMPFLCTPHAESLGIEKFKDFNFPRLA